MATAREKFGSKRLDSFQVVDDMMQFNSSRAGGSSCPSSPNVKKAYRLVVLGSPKTGKTSIVNRFLQDRFEDNYTPTIENFHRKIYKIRDNFYQLDILDTSGYCKIAKTSINIKAAVPKCDIFLLVFSMDNLDSYEEVFRLHAQIIDEKQILTGKTDDKKLKIPILIAANKTDLHESKQVVHLKEARDKVDKLNSCALVDCSAKFGHNIDEVFTKLFELSRFPKEITSPQTHKKLTSNMSVDRHLRGSKTPLIRLRSKHSEPALMTGIDTEARRPSLRTDLLILRAKASGSGQFSTKSLPAASGSTQQRQNHIQDRIHCCVQ